MTIAGMDEYAEVRRPIPFASTSIEFEKDETTMQRIL
jgi:hypothetical protein